METDAAAAAPEDELDTIMLEITNKRLGRNTEGTTAGIHEDAIEEG